MSLSLEQLASLTDSTLVGDGSILIHNVAALQDADNGDISFLNNPKYRKYLADSKASAIILSPDLAEAYQGNVLINKDPYMTFARVLKALFAVEKPEANIHASAVVAEDATMGEGVNIGANSVIEAGVNLGNNVVIGAGCVIGENCVLADDVVLHANVTLYSDTKIGARSAIHSGTVLGADGFGYAPQQDKSWYKILQIGNVVIGDDVEIGANTTIDRAALGSTRIGNGTKLDNQIQIAHNVCVGENTVIAGCAAIAGSTTIGDRCQIGGTVAMGGHLTIADDVIITGNSMVMKSIKKAGVYSSGVATEENRKWRRNAARFRQLDELAKIIKRLERDHDNR